jgi:hypothetical protein
MAANSSMPEFPNASIRLTIVPNKTVLLILPPVSKPCEPTAGLAKLAFALRKSGVDCRLYDANIDCLLGLETGGDMRRTVLFGTIFKRIEALGNSGIEELAAMAKFYM